MVGAFPRIFSIMLAALAAGGVSAQGLYVFRAAELLSQADTVYANKTESPAAGDISLKVRSLNFFRNNEWFGDYAEGYTLPGYRLAPLLQFRLADCVALEAGCEMTQYGGQNSFNEVYPIVSAVWRIRPGMTLRMGVIDNAGAHGLHQAEYDDERVLTQRPETGFQFFRKGRVIDVEAWIDWAQFIFRGDTIPEKFMAGASAVLRLGERMTVPIDFTASHIGGQISDFAEPMQSLANGRVGVSYAGGCFYAMFDALFFKALAGGQVRPFDKGGAFDVEVGLRSKIFRGQVGYVHLKDYFAPRGMPLLVSLSNYLDVYTPRRDVVRFEASIEKEVHPAMRFSLDFRAWHDCGAGQFEYTYGLGLSVCPHVKLFAL